MICPSNMSINKYDELKKLQKVLLEILTVVDSFCREHSIRYSLCGGSLLGAIRHGGFIPWDDDVDIIMKRSDYDRFIELWQNSHPEGYVLQGKEINAISLSVPFLKIRKDKTTFLQFEMERGEYHLGIFIDIFSMDRIPSNKLLRSVFLWRCLKYQLYVREYVPPTGNLGVKVMSKLFLLFTNSESRKKKRAKLLEKMTMYNNDESLCLVATETVKSLSIIYSPILFDELIPIRFENKEFFCFKEWEEYLSRFYGDYLQLPPIEERTWAHPPIIIDFEHNYEDLKSK